MARVEISLRKITTEQIWMEVQKLKDEIETHSHSGLGANGQVLNGSIEGIIQSANFVTGASGSGWRLSPNGDIEANSGNFRGDITGASGTFTDSIAIGSGNSISKIDANGLYVGHATFGSAPFRVDMAGALVATSATITGTFTITGGSGIASLSDAGALAVKDDIGASDCDTTIIDGNKIITGLLTADNIQTGTLTGRTVRTSAGGDRIQLADTDDLEFYHNNSLAAEISTLGSSILYIKTVGTGNATIIWNDTDGIGLSIFGNVVYSKLLLPDTTTSRDLGSNSYEWRDLYLSRNLIIGGTVDGVDIQSHADRHIVGGDDSIIVSSQSSASAYGISAGWAYTHDNNVSAHHNILSNGYSITPLSVNCTGAIDLDGNLTFDAANRDIVRGSNLVFRFLASDTVCSTNFRTDAEDLNLGSADAGEHWNYIYGNYLRYDIDSTSFQTHDDIALLKAIKTITKDGKEVFDKKTFPKEIVGDDNMFDVANMNGFLLGTLKQLNVKIEESETKIKELEIKLKEK